jgi:hypothetical protein
MIERLVFISTMVLFLMVGINAFIAMGNEMCMPDGSKLNLTGTAINDCGTMESISNGQADINGMITASNELTPNTDSAGANTNTAAGSAGSVINFLWSGVSGAQLGIQWIWNTMTGVQMLGNKLMSLMPFLSPLILIFVGVTTLLEAFAIMYWTMAGARALLGRFL